MAKILILISNLIIKANDKCLFHSFMSIECMLGEIYSKRFDPKLDYELSVIM